MASSAQINANRLNAQRSTGPRTDEGKAVSRFNALKYGAEARSLVIPGEDPNELETLALDYHDQFNPAGPLERFLVNALIRADWDRRRYARIEAQVLDDALSGPDAGSSADALAGKAAQLVFRRLAYAERLYFRSLKELRRAQKERQSQEVEAGEARQSPAPSPTPLDPEEPPIGFVSPNPPSIPPASPRAEDVRRLGVPCTAVPSTASNHDGSAL